MNNKVKKMVGIALLSAVIVVLQYVFGSITVGGTSINPVLVPVVVGAAVYGWQAGAVLGLVSGIAILISGAANFFLGFSVAGTVIVVLLKGTVSGLIAGLSYKLLQKRNQMIAVLTAAVLCPLVNTGIFVAGCYTFFLQDVLQLAGGSNMFTFVMTVFVGINIFVELGINLILSPVILRLIKIGKK